MPRWWKVGRARTGPGSFVRSPDYRGSGGSSANQMADVGSSGLYRSKPGTKLWRPKMAAGAGLRGIGQLFAQLWRGHGIDSRITPDQRNQLSGADFPASPATVAPPRYGSSNPAGHAFSITICAPSLTTIFLRCPVDSQNCPVYPPSVPDCRLIVAGSVEATEVTQTARRIAFPFSSSPGGHLRHAEHSSRQHRDPCALSLRRSP